MRDKSVRRFTASLATRAHDGSVVVSLFDDAGGCAALLECSPQAGAALLANLAETLAHNVAGEPESAS